MLPVSVVIPTRDRPAQLHDAIASILAGACLPAEIVVADQSTGPMRPLPAPAGGRRAPRPPRHARAEPRAQRRPRGRPPRPARVRRRRRASPTRSGCAAWSRARGVPDPHRDLRRGPPTTARATASSPRVTRRTEPETLHRPPVRRPALRRETWRSAAPPSTSSGRSTSGSASGAASPPPRTTTSASDSSRRAGAIRFVPDAIVRHRGARHGRELLRLDWAYCARPGRVLRQAPARERPLHAAPLRAQRPLPALPAAHGAADAARRLDGGARARLPGGARHRRARSGRAPARRDG